MRMHTNSAVPSLLSIAEVASRLTISQRSVRALISCGKLRTVRVTERRVAVDEADLSAYVAARRAEPREGAAA